MATIHEVAERAGVSTKTVSRYLSGFPGVSARTIAKIKKASEELEFFPSAAARTLRGASSGIVCLIADNLTTTPTSFDIVKGIHSACEARGKLLLIGETRAQEATLNELVQRFREQKAEAIIHAAEYHREISVQQSFEHCPLVLVNCFDADGRYPSVVPDDEQGAYELTKFLIGIGHREIAFITLSDKAIAQRMRDRGFSRAMAEAGVPIDLSWIVREAWVAGEVDPIWVQNVIETLMAGPSRPTAIMCANDKMALRVIMHLRNLGYRVPEDVTVVGFDDYKPISENTLPGLTTVALPFFEMGYRAAETALKMGSQPVQVTQEKLKCALVLRESHCAIAAPPV